jgi:hypothetical protein
MHPYRIIILINLLVTGFCYSQSEPSVNQATDQLQLFSSDSVEIKTSNKNSDWKLYLDKDSKKLFIDFKTLGGDFSKLAIFNEDGDIIFSDKYLIGLPVNTIYEIDLYKFTRGIYFLELYSKDKFIKEEFSIQ